MMYVLNKINTISLLKAKPYLCKTFSSLYKENVDKMRLFWEKELIHTTNLCYDLLNAEEKAIHNRHEDAVKMGHFTYHDPKTNERILTRLRHFLRGKCCGNACRHCTYNHSNVTDEYKLRVRKFNSSFWTYPDEVREVDFDESCYFDGSNLRARIKRTPTMTFGFSKV